MSTQQIILLVIAILAVNTITLMIAFVWVRNRSERFITAMRASMLRSGESFIIEPERAVFRGRTGKIWVVKTNGVIALTDKRLTFMGMIGGRFDIPISDIESVSENKWFLGSTQNLRQHLILTLRDDTQIGFFVDDHNRWMREVQDAIQPSGTQ